MLKKRKIIAPSILILSILALGIVGATSISAQESGNYSLIVRKIAEKFNLDEDDVQGVFDEVKEERHAEMYANLEQRLTDAVNDGKLTEDQKKAILEKHGEIHDKMSQLKDMSPEEKKVEIQRLHEDLKKWAEENEVELWRFGLFGGGFRKGFRMGHFMGMHQ